VYETSIKDGRLTQVAAGDLNHDGRTDLAVIETKDHFVEILTFGPDEGLIRGNKFRVFAKKQFSRRRRGAAEPRWITIADLTNDGHDDLLLIAHDRILLYPGQ
ncbi:MAG: FG-GAP repeat protein, partial [Planctomycetes bacterium]|nr:FG-GAP repeat protein [Planctomycetota bacterium]